MPRLFFMLGCRHRLLHLRGKYLQPSERNRQLNKDTYDVLSIPGYVIKKIPSHGARHGPTVRHKIHHKAHDMLKKDQKKQCSTFWKGGTETISTKVLCLKLGGMKKQEWPTTRSHLRTTPTLRREKKEVGTRTHGNSH